MTSQTTVKMVTLTINGQAVVVPDKTLLIEAAQQAGVQVPHFCYHPKLKPDANCRMCLVEIEKIPKLQTSCTTPVSEGMVVYANSDRVEEARSGVMEFILSNHPLDCPICDQGGECHLQDQAQQHSGQYSRFVEIKRSYEKEYFGPIIEKEMNRCVQCMRCTRYCDEVIDSNALGGLERGVHTEPGTFLRQELDCEFCGGCIQICPVGALTSRVSMYDYRPWQLKKTETTCVHCSDGCLLKLESRDEKVMRVTSETNAGRNAGDLCAKGFFGFQFINHSDRLTEPLIRRDEALSPSSWYEVMPEAATELMQIKSRFGGDAIGGVIAADCTNEEAYLFQKFMRLALGSNHVDSTARLGHLNALRGLYPLLGNARMMNSYEEILQADLIVLLGSDLTEANPIVGLKVKAAVREHGARLINIHSFQPNPGTYISNLLNRSHLPLQVKVGGEGAAIRGLVKAALEQNFDSSILGEGATDFLAKLRQAAGTMTYDQLSQDTGLAREDFQQVAKALHEAERAIILVGEDVIRVSGGHLNMMHLCDLAALTGNLQAEGCGINALCREANEQGVVEMGVAPEFLPGLKKVDDPKAREDLAAIWGEAPDLGKGGSLLEMLQKARRGEIKALYLVGVDPLSLFPDTLEVREALQNLELLICQDQYLTPTSQFAHMVLPACSFAEKDGTFTNQEGNIQKVNQAIEPVEDSLADWEIFRDLSRHLQYPLDYESPREIFSEIVQVIPSYRHRHMPSLAASERQDLVKHYVAAGYQQDFEERWAQLDKVAGDTTSANYPYLLKVGPTLFHGSRFTQRSDALMKISSEGVLKVHPEDAEALGLTTGDQVRVQSEQGSSDVKIEVSEKLPKGLVHYPEAFLNSGLKALLSVQWDSTTQVPYWKPTPVKIERMS